MKRLNPARHPLIAKVLVLICAIAIASFLMSKPQPVAAAGPFNVNSTLDLPDLIPGDGFCGAAGAICTLRAAVMEANATAGADTINLPAGTYTLSLGPFDDEFTFNGANEGTGDLDVLGSDLTIIGAGSGTTIIDGGSLDRVFDVNNFAGPGNGVNLTLQNLTIRNGSGKTGTAGFFHSGGAIQFDGLDYTSTFSPAGVTLTLSNCVISNNSAAGNGGGIAIFNGGSLNISNTSFTGNQSLNASGGAVMFDGAPDPGTRTLSITNSSFSNNSATNAIFGSGAGVWASGNANLTIENNSFSNNTAGADGGGIWTQAFLASNAKAINKNTLTGNSAKTGGGIYDSNGVLTFNFNVVVGNTATTLPTSSGLRHLAGTANADNNWWGCNAGPAANPCDRALGVISLAAWLKLSHTASPNSIAINQSTTLQADFFTNNLGAAIAASDLVALNGRAVTFNNAVLGTISGADSTINAGKANATFTAGATPGSGSADATVDQATVTASITIGQAAEVTTNPTDQTVCEGSTATFTAASSGFPTPTVQWQASTDGGANFNDIPGATSTTLSFTATAADNGNKYRAVFTNAGGTATTTAATLTVNTSPVVTTNPTSQTACEGQPVSFTAAASGSPAPTVQWQVSSGGPFSNISGATSTTLSFTATTADNGKSYRAVFTNECGSANSTAATLTVNQNTTATDPADQTVCQGATANFSTSASGSNISYAWTLDGSPFGGNTSSISVPTGSLGIGNHTVGLTVTGDCGTVTQSATLTVQENTTATDPADQTVCQGATANFSTTASGSNVSYAWTLDGSPFGGNTSSISVPTGSLSIGNHTVGLTVTGDCGTVTQSATLTVQENTSTTDPADQTVCQGATANFSTTASGTGPFTYAWTVDGSPFGGSTSSISVDTTSLSVSNHTVAVTVSGTCGSASQSANLTVQATTTTTDPADVTVCNGQPANFSTTAGGTGPFHYSWTLDGNPVGGDSPNVTIPTIGLSQGVHTVAVTTTGTCGSASQSANLTVNNAPPSITVTTGNINVWPPNHQYQTFTLADFGVSASSGCDGNLTNSVVIASVTSDEPEDSAGADGNTLNDIVIGANCKTVQLRRERNGNLNGRVYTIILKVTDSVGQTATVAVTVSVPLNQNGNPAVNNPGGGYTVNSLCP